MKLWLAKEILVLFALLIVSVLIFAAVNDPFALVIYGGIGIGYLLVWAASTVMNNIDEKREAEARDAVRSARQREIDALVAAGRIANPGEEG